MELQSLKQRYDIVGDDPLLNRALDIALQVASTDLSVLVTGESGVGKESIPKIIHDNSPRRHGVYIAVNCGAIPEGTIDSELFGHEKGSFTGANETRKGYFEVADKGTIFLDEVAELPLSTQVRLLRVLQSGEFMKVGSSKTQKTDVRVVAATNINILNAVKMGKFREDLYYRLATVPISLPPLRERKGDVYLLFRKFAADFADKYNIPSVKLTHDAQVLLSNYRWPGNIRQLKNVAEQVSILEPTREVDAEKLSKYLPQDSPDLLPVLRESTPRETFLDDKEIIYRMILSLKQDVDSLRERLTTLQSGPRTGEYIPPRRGGDESTSVEPAYSDLEYPSEENVGAISVQNTTEAEYAEVPEKELANLSIKEAKAELIKASLIKHKGKRKAAARELGISERTLYRKIKELGLEKKKK